MVDKKGVFYYQCVFIFLGCILIEVMMRVDDVLYFLIINYFGQGEGVIVIE